MEINNETEGAPEMVTDVHTKKPVKQGFWASLLDFARFAGIVLIVVVGIRYFIAQPFIVSGTSMVPTFENSNYLIVDELSYRFESPHRGDVIIFHPPIDMKTYYIKRIIGIPGDTVRVRDGVISITNKEHPDGFVLNEPYVNKDVLTENVTTEVTAGNYFVMGDNRSVSYDSRRWGLLPAQNITGRAFLRLFPLSEINIFPGEHTTY
jgi:signal peptidase I